MYSGDETGGLVIDYGSHSGKFGFAGEDCPRLVKRTQHDFSKEFSGALTELCFSLDQKDHPIILTVPVFLSDKEKLARTEQALEAEAPAVFLIRSAVAAAFAAGKSTALVVEIGASAATACPVFDGYSLLRSTKTSPACGGAALSKDIAALTKLHAPSANDSWAKRSQYLDRIDDIKHSCCFIKRIPGNDALPEGIDKPETYLLPDGKTIKLGSKRHEVCETIFDMNNGLGALVYDALASCDADLRKTFSQEILIVGGGSLLEGLPERLGFDLATRLPLSFKPRVLSLGTTVERRFAPFVGCSVLASLGSFQQMWLSRKEWDEHGEKLALERFAN